MIDSLGFSTERKEKGKCQRRYFGQNIRMGIIKVPSIKHGIGMEVLKGAMYFIYLGWIVRKIWYTNTYCHKKSFEDKKRQLSVVG